ncbi:hypothetical protein ILUMI_16610, partial [Ignelater luminosus]
MDPTDDINNSNASEKLEAMQSELHCGICHDYFVQAFTLSCSHSFCFDCISAWRANHTDCPVCRRKTVGMAPSRALDNMVAALNGGANITNSGSNENQQRVDAWFNTPQNAAQQQQQQNNAHQAEPEADPSYNGESDDGTFFDSEEEGIEEDDGDYDNNYDDDYYEEEEEGYEDEGEEEQEEEQYEEGEEEGDYEDDESSYSDSEYDDEDEYYEDD